MLGISFNYKIPAVIFRTDQLGKRTVEEAAQKACCNSTILYHQSVTLT